MTIVSNASPLINLARIGKLDLLRQLYGEVLVPQAVWQEVVLDGAERPGADEVKTSTWIQMRTIGDQRLAQALRQELGAGEAEAIVLAIELQAELLLMDERLGRETARYLGVRPIGLMGVLLEAKHRRLIPAIKPHLDALCDFAGFRVRDALYQQILQDEGEI
ncbi:MAG: DUF3368 domain-containing protein [Caldilinea sp.]|uniref:DUF3368 domain-containing protein n=1 Tax=Caldilinea sp. TaxID=2293560 RepID=UPI0030B72663